LFDQNYSKNRVTLFICSTKLVQKFFLLDNGNLNVHYFSPLVVKKQTYIRGLKYKHLQ